MITLKEIASHFGCSVATVSKALNHMPDINPHKAEQIRMTAIKMGYLPNAAARTLKTNRSRTVGIIAFLHGESIWSHEYFTRVADSIQDVMSQSGYDISPINCGEASVMGSYLAYCLYRGYDGVMVISTGIPTQDVLELMDSRLPVVTIDCAFPNRGAVLSDNVQGVRDLVHYAYAKGHRRIAFIHGEDAMVTRDRQSGFLTACKELRIPTPEAYLQPALYHDYDTNARATRALMQLPQPPTCILYPDDHAYVGGMDVLLGMGLSIPRDISVLGYDGQRVAEVVRPRLTTLRQDAEGIGGHAANMLLRSIEKPRTFTPRHMWLPGTLVEGDSVRDVTGVLS